MSYLRLEDAKYALKRLYQPSFFASLVYRYPGEGAPIPWRLEVLQLQDRYNYGFLTHLQFMRRRNAILRKNGIKP